MDKKTRRNFLWVALLVLGTIWILARHNQPVPYQKDHGLIFGSIDHIPYHHASNLEADVEN